VLVMGVVWGLIGGSGRVRMCYYTSSGNSFILFQILDYYSLY
jgi:hypothetical protein